MGAQAATGTATTGRTSAQASSEARPAVVGAEDSGSLRPLRARAGARSFDRPCTGLYCAVQELVEGRRGPVGAGGRPCGGQPYGCVSRKHRAGPFACSFLLAQV